MNKSLDIEVRKYESFLEDEKVLIEKAKFPQTDFEAWTAQGTNTQLSYATHGIFRYFGKFPPTIGKKLILDYTQECETVYDLMSGSGTTGVECLLSNRECILNDVNPLSVLLAKVKTTKLDDAIIETLFLRIKQNYKPLSRDEYDDEIVGLKDIDHWFLPSTVNSLRGIKKLILEIEEEKYRNYFLICFAAIIRNVSKATTQQGRLFLDVLTAKEDAFEQFEKKIKTTRAGVCSLPNSNKIDILNCNIMEPLSNDYYNKSKLTILHPPYFNSYKYSSINSLELAWLGTNHADIRKEEVKEFFKVGQAQNVQRYVDDMAKVVDNAEKTLLSDGHMAIMIGDTVIKGEYVPATSLLIKEIAQRTPSLKLEKIILRVPKYTEASWAASQRRQKNDVGIKLCDFILIYRK